MEECGVSLSDDRRAILGGHKCLDCDDAFIEDGEYGIKEIWCHRKGEKLTRQYKRKPLTEDCKKRISESLKKSGVYSKGKTWEELFGKEKADEMKRNLSRKVMIKNKGGR